MDGDLLSCPLFGVQIMAGAEGFEPPNARTKTWCLTTWRRPIDVNSSTFEVPHHSDTTPKVHGV